MIVSHRHRFIFIKTVKTAGTSIEVFLAPHCGRDDVLTPIFPPVAPHEARNHAGYFNPLPELLGPRIVPPRRTLRDLLRRRRFFNHMPARLVRARVPRAVWDGYLTFCVERNPWDKTLSHYHMLRHRADGTLTLDDYLRQGRLAHNLGRYTDAHGAVMVDRVVRYERLQEDLAEVFEHLGIPFDGSLGVRAKGHFRRDRRPYQDVFTPAQRDEVARLFASEIALHGYTF